MKGSFKSIIEVACILCMICGLLSYAVVASNKVPDFTESTYIVETGDCLWNIASEYCPETMDKRDYIKLVMERNELSNSIIYPGQSLVVFAISD